ncbi:MAG: cytochrome o ubiquinol oxidase subunit III [Chromatiaceae bacterium]|nr:cytochrome o ubiquinol oxidase subunit III [Chromatiaceae bacterium]MCP5314464.1 cytochrome o ubiquinol oxidase subunit III [Chromatiaceae bacterium]
MSDVSITDAIVAQPGNGFAETRATRALGFWIYLMSDAVIFALLFATYATMIGNYADGPSGKTLFNLTHTLGETTLLLTSSLTCGLATWSAQQRRGGTAVAWLLVTLALGLGFIGMEIVEFMGLLHQGAGPQRSGFLSAFFTLVGTHGLHVSVGIVWLLVMIAQIVIKGPSSWVQSRLQRWSTFWHFLDIVWVGIFSIVYLPGML